MAMPPFKKVWTVSANNTIAQTGTVATDHKNLLWKVKERFCTVGGWAVLGSSDSVTAGLDAVDRWVAAANLVWTGTGGVHSWIVLQQTGLLANFQLLIDCACTTNPGNNERYIKAYASFSAGFTGGNTTTRPSATDEITLRDGTAGVNGTWFHNFTSTFNSAVHYILSDDHACHRVILCANGYSFGFAIFDVLGEYPASLTQPVVVGWKGGTATDSRCNYGYWNDAAQLSGRYGGAAYTAYMTSEGYASAMIGQQYGTCEIDGQYLVSPIGVTSETRGATGRMGALYDIWWGSAGTKEGTCYPMTGARTHVQFGNLVFPWTDVIPVVR